MFQMGSDGLELWVKTGKEISSVRLSKLDLVSVFIREKQRNRMRDLNKYFNSLLMFMLY